MKRFTQLFNELDQATDFRIKIRALVGYFHDATDQDKLWAIALLSQKRPKRSITSKQLRKWGKDFSGLSDWLFEHSYALSGDVAETVALVLPPPYTLQTASLTDWVTFLKEIPQHNEETVGTALKDAWNQMGYAERLVFNKLIIGGFRMTLKRSVLASALSEYTGIDKSKLASQLMSTWTPDSITFSEFISAADLRTNIGKPFPFYQPEELNMRPETLGNAQEWLVEHLWDGIRGQIIVRQKEIFIWINEEELATDKFPEFHPLLQILPQDSVLVGDIIPYKNRSPLSIELLESRMKRKSITRPLMEEVPVIFMAYDLLEFQGVDMKALSLQDRKMKLKSLDDLPGIDAIVRTSPSEIISDWHNLNKYLDRASKAHSYRVIIKSLKSRYPDGNDEKPWLKIKADPLTIVGVLMYVQTGADRVSEYTFGVRKNDQFVSFCKVKKGLTEIERQEIDQFTKLNTVERFGPVRAVNPILVFEIGFESIHVSSRHKSRVTIRHPFIKEWKKNKIAEDANTIKDLQSMIKN